MPTSSPSSTPASTRTPVGSRSRSIVPDWGRNVRGSSAYSLTSIAWPAELGHRRQRAAFGELELGGDEVEPGDELRDRMLDLDPAVQLQEEELAAVEDELGRAGAAV